MTVLDTLVSVRLKTQATADKNAVADSDTLLCLKLRRLRLSFKRNGLEIPVHFIVLFSRQNKKQIFFHIKSKL